MSVGGVVDCHAVEVFACAVGVIAHGAEELREAGFVVGILWVEIVDPGAACKVEAGSGGVASGEYGEARRLADGRGTVGTLEGPAFMGQLVGALVIFIWVFFASLIVWGILKAIMGIRVSEEEEYEGVDQSECGMEAYPEFVGASGSGT